MAGKRKGRGKPKKAKPSKKSRKLPVSLEGINRPTTSLTLRLSEAPAKRVGLIPQSKADGTSEKQQQTTEANGGEKAFRNKEKVLVLSSRGIVSR